MYFGFSDQQAVDEANEEDMDIVVMMACPVDAFDLELVGKHDGDKAHD